MKQTTWPDAGFTCRNKMPKGFWGSFTGGFRVANKKRGVSPSFVKG